MLEEDDTLRDVWVKQLAKGIPVLWLINNDNVDPPWGKVARIKV